MVHTHGDVARINKALREVEHDLAAVLLLDEGSYAYAVADASGEILAWDGWYTGFGEEEAPEVTALADVDWEDWDDMPTKLLIRSQSQWASDRMAFWLIPTFSPAREAGALVASHADQETSSIAAKGLRNSRVVAYLPIVDREVYEARRTR